LALAFDIQVPRVDADHYTLSACIFMGSSFGGQDSRQEARVDALVRGCEHAFALIVGPVTDAAAFEAWQAHAAAAVAALDAPSPSGRPRLLVLVVPLPATGTAVGSPPWFTTAGVAVGACLTKLATQLSKPQRAKVALRFEAQLAAEGSAEAAVALLAGLSGGVGPYGAYEQVGAAGAAHALRSYGSLAALAVAVQDAVAAAAGSGQEEDGGYVWSEGGWAAPAAPTVTPLASVSLELRSRLLGWSGQQAEGLARALLQLPAPVQLRR
jgi:hypothetical protein